MRRLTYGELAFQKFIATWLFGPVVLLAFLITWAIILGVPTYGLYRLATFFMTG